MKRFLGMVVCLVLSWPVLAQSPVDSSTRYESPAEKEYQATVDVAEKEISVKMAAAKKEYDAKEGAARKVLITKLKGELGLLTQKGDLDGALAVRVRIKELESSRDISVQDVTFLTDLTPSCVDSWGGGISSCKEGEPAIMFRGQALQKSILMHVPKGVKSVSLVRYPLQGKYSNFASLVSLVDGAKPRSAATFQVWGDGKMLWTSKPVKDQGGDQCLVSVKGVQVLELRVCPSSDDNGFGWTVWITPCLK